MSSLLRRMACGTDKGAVRKANQDCVAIFPEMNLAVLADGMGGHKAGEVASRMAIQVISESIDKGIELRESVILANDKIFQRSQMSEAEFGMGTTLVACQYDGLQATIINVGDSRLYRHRKGAIKQITRDQTVAQEMKDSPQGVADGYSAHKYEHVLTQALGIQRNITPVMSNEVFEPGDIHLLCSDGLSGAIDDELMNQFLLTQSESLDACIQSMLTASLKRFASDNVSIALVRSLKGE
ncbi:MAG: serine/threonine protein phosphatase PrpC [Saprospiraceae bacterium]|jgi:serine/threonine protein phosphatase PrpC